MSIRRAVDPPRRLAPELNTEGYDQRPSVSRDGRELYLSLTRSGGRGSADIWVAKRAGTGNRWSEPVNAGAAINSEFEENHPSISADGTVLFFTSRRPWPEGEACGLPPLPLCDFDIYVATPRCAQPINDPISHCTGAMRPATTLLISILAGAVACGDDGGTGLDGDPRAISLAVGEVRTIGPSEAEPLRVNGGSAGAEFTLIPVYESEVPSATVGLQFSGERLTVPTGPPMPHLGAPVAAPSLRDGGLAFAPPLESFQAHLYRVARDVLVPRIPAARAAHAALRARTSETTDVPSVGTALQLNTSTTSACSDPDVRTGRVVAVTAHAIVVADEANPALGFTDAEYAEIGQGFDALTYPVIAENFGAPSDIDANGGRIIIASPLRARARLPARRAHTRRRRGARPTWRTRRPACRSRRWHLSTC